MSAFTDEQINEIIGIFTQHMGTRQYIGARYVPIFGRKDETSIDWDNTKPYEPLTIVLYQGNSYTSRQYVPSGVDILNTEFWANTGNYNAQVEQYRTEVLTFNDRITENADDIEAISDSLGTGFSAQNTVKNYIDTKTDNINAAIGTGFSAQNTIEDNVATNANNISDISNLIPNTDFDSTNTVKRYIDSKIASVETVSYGKRIIVIGDSYGQGYTPDGNVTGWCALIKERLEYAGYTVHTQAAGRVGFVGDSNGYKRLLQNIVNELDEQEKQEVSKILFAGGFNDRNNTAAQISVGVREVMLYINQELPNAIVYCSYIGSAVSGLAAGSHAGATLGQNITGYKNYITACAENGVVYDEGGWATLCRNSFFSSDYVHPNANGQTIIANALLPFVLTGNSVRLYDMPANAATFTKDSNVSNAFAPNIYFTRQKNGIPCNYFFGNFATGYTATFESPVNITGNTNSIRLGVYNDACFTGIQAVIPINAIIHFSGSNGGYMTCPAMIYIEESGAASLRWRGTTKNWDNYQTGTVDQVQIFGIGCASYV